MSTRVIDGAYTTLYSKVPSNAAARFGAIGVIGHMLSGISYDTNVSGTILSQPNGDYTHFSGTSLGIVYEFNSFDEAVRRFGIIPETSWTSGTYGLSGTDTSPYDGKYNLIRALELIYLANANVRTYVACLGGTGTSAAAADSSTGVTQALSELLKYDDISFIVGAGMDFSSTLTTHAETAANDTNQAERIYVGGTSLQEVMASGSRVPDLNADEGQDTDQSALLADSGRAVFVACNVRYKFQSDPNNTDIPTDGYEIGGNFYSAYLAGLLSSLPEQRSLLRLGTNFAQKYNGNNFRWSRSDQEELVNGSVLHFKTSGGRTTFSRALTYSSTSSSFRRITTRRIVDRVLKEVRATSETFVGKDNTEINRIGIKSSLDSKMAQLQRFGMIQPGTTVNVWVEEGDVAAGTVRVSSLFKPITEIEFVEIQMTFEL